MATRITLKEFQETVKAVVQKAVIAGKFDEIVKTEGITGLVNKIAEQVTLDGNFADKLPELDAKELPYGNIIEEWYQGLVPVRDFEAVEGNEAEVELSPAFPDYEEPAYSQSFDRKYFKTSLTYDQYNAAVNNPDGLAALTNMVVKRLYDSYAQYRYNCKKELIVEAGNKAITKMETALNFNTGTLYEVGAVVNDTDVFYMVRKTIPATNTDNIEILKEKGYVVDYNVITKGFIAPTTEAECKAFVKEIKKLVEVSQFANEGNSLAGNTIGAEDGLVLILPNGIMPEIETELYAGAFNKDNLAMPCKVVRVDNLGSAGSCNVNAVLMDSRAIKLHPQYVRFGETEVNGGDYRNLFLHTKQIGYISKFAFMHVWCDL